MLINAQCIQYNSKGSSINFVRETTNNIIWTVRSFIDQLSVYCVETSGCIPNMLQYMLTSDLSTIDPTCITDDTSSLQFLESQITEVLSNLELYYGNFSCEMSSVLDSWISTLKQIRDYDIKRYQLY